MAEFLQKVAVICTCGGICKKKINSSYIVCNVGNLFACANTVLLLKIRPF